jgi:thiol-disulfide isomerase/thioredoxin
MTRTLHLALRAFTLMASASALLGTLWLSHARASEGGEDPQAAIEQVASGVDFDTSRVKLVVFAMTSCGHCKHFKKELATLHTAVPELVIELVEYAPGANTAANRAAQQRANLAAIQGYPTTLVIIDGSSAGRMAGYRPAPDVVRVISQQVKDYDRALQASM